jgi:alkanesulfonate monooxygenase SsuD/methylene tetrahydromethanopterin reductase-like flavin-dependent oxidoreductase (luciferase family)
MLADALPIIKAMWTEDYATYEGKYHQVHGAINEPKGVQKPHPPIWIGGGGEKVTLKLVARYGDASNFPGLDPEAFRAKAAVLRQHCETVGRDYDSIIKSTNIIAMLLDPTEVDQAEALTAPYRGPLSLEDARKSAFIGTPSELIALCNRLQEAGATYFIFYVPGVATDLTRLRLLAREVLPALHG